MNGGERIAEILLKKRVKFVFTLCGGHISPILVGCKNRGIRVIDVRQEETAVFAADAVGRLTGTPGIAAVTAGPGVTNTITAIKNAQMAQSPIIVLGGAVPTILKGRGALQDIDQMSIIRPIVKWAARIKQNCDIEPFLEKAFNVAVSGVPGPVFIECPIDLLYDEALVREWYIQQSTQPRSVKDRILNWYLNHHLDYIYACHSEGSDNKGRYDDEKVDEERHHLAVESPSLDSSAISGAVKMINQSCRPVLLLGSQTTADPSEIPSLIRAIESTKIPLFLSGMSRGLLGATHELQYRHHRTAALKEADLVLLAGVPMDFRLNYGLNINPKARLISINRALKDIRKNRWPKLGLHGDPATFLISVASSPELKDNREKWASWTKTLSERELSREKEIREMSEAPTDFLNPLHFCGALDRAIEEDGVLVADGGDFVATASYILRPRGPLTWLDPGAFGTLGVGAGFALGAGLVNPEKTIWLLYGDGAAGYSLIEFDTFVRHQVPVIAVIGNDGGWAQIARDQVAILKDDVATVLSRSDYHTIPQAFGGKGYKIEKTEEISTVLAQATADAKNGMPVVVNAMIGATDFRKGSISM
ncbi:MAG: thiamine pyrophosphate-binding protein [Myxococcota bacterium]|nr:thiamine pyrophosphate-binding protein [Myxococcota bacterium]